MTTRAPGALPPDTVVAFVLIDLTVILVVARVAGAAARRIGQPSVVGEITAGVLLGPSLLGANVFHWDRPWSILRCDEALAGTGLESSITSCVFPPQAQGSLALLGQVALILFTFLVGLNLDQRTVRRSGGSVVGVAAMATALPVATGVVIAPLLYRPELIGADGAGQPPTRLGFSLMVGAMLAVTALPVMARILEERGLSGSRLGTLGVASAAAITVLMFLAMATARDVARGQDAATISLRWILATLFTFFVLGPLRAALAPVGRAIEKRGELSATAFAGILTLVLALSLFTDRLGLHVMPGAFLAGAILPARAFLRHHMAARLRDVTVVVLLPVFLTHSGLNTDFTVLGWSTASPLLLLLVAAVASKWLGGVIGARLAGFRWSDTHALGVLMNCRGMLVLIVGLAAVQSGVFSPAMQAGGVLIALLTTIMTAPLLGHFLTSPVEALSPNGVDDRPAVRSGGRDADTSTKRSKGHHHDHSLQVGR